MSRAAPRLPDLPAVRGGAGEIVQVQAWMGHADVQTTMKYMHHRSRAGDARLLSVAFMPKKPAAARRRSAPNTATSSG